MTSESTTLLDIDVTITCPSFEAKMCVRTALHRAHAQHSTAYGVLNGLYATVPAASLSTLQEVCRFVGATIAPFA